jgi:hypothetical protein
MEVFKRNIKIYYTHDNYYALGTNGGSGYIVATDDDTGYLGYKTACSNNDITFEKIIIKINYKTIFLTKDNIIFFWKERSYGNTAIDLNNKTIIHFTEPELVNFLDNLSKRESIVIKNDNR